MPKETITPIKSDITMAVAVRAELVRRYLALYQPSNSSKVIALECQKKGKVTSEGPQECSVTELLLWTSSRKCVILV